MIRGLGLAALSLWCLSGCAPKADPAPSADRAGRDEAAAPEPRPDPRVVLPFEPVEVLSREPWEFGPHRGVAERTRRYRVFTTLAPGRMRDRLAPFMERVLGTYTRELGPLPQPTVLLDVYVLRDREQWARMTRQELRDDAGPYLAIQRGGFSWRGRAFFYDLGDDDTLSLAAHEGWHQYTQTVFKEPLPVWLEEGLASWMEGHRVSADGRVSFAPWSNAKRHAELVRLARAGERFSVRDMLDQTPQELLVDQAGSDASALGYYARAWALAAWLISEPDGTTSVRRAKLRELLADAAGGRMSARVNERLGVESNVFRNRRGPWVFRAYVEPDLEAADRAFAAFVAAITAEGSGERVRNGLPPASASRP